MKTSIDIPDDVLAKAMHYTQAKTKREAVVTVMEEFVQRRRMAELVAFSGTFTSLPAHEELKAIEKARNDTLDRIGRHPPK